MLVFGKSKLRKEFHARLCRIRSITLEALFYLGIMPEFGTAVYLTL